MESIKSCLVEMNRQFSTRIQYGESALNEAVTWLAGTLADRRNHTHLKVQECLTSSFEPTGVGRVDKMLGADFQGGFLSGNVSSNLQSSLMLPARSTVEVNGFEAIDGLKILPGYLQAKALDPMLKSPWNDQRDRLSLARITDALKMLHEDTACTVYRIFHMRSVETRDRQPSPVHAHGWLVVDDEQKIVFRTDYGDSGVGQKLMQRAAQILSCEHTCPVSLLEITQGKITLLDDSVLNAFHRTGQTETREEILEFEINPVPSWQRTETLEAAEIPMG